MPSTIAAGRSRADGGECGWGDVYLDNPNNKWEWTLRPEVVKALENLGKRFW